MSRAYGWAADGRTVVAGEADEIRRWADYLLDDTADPTPTRRGLAADLAARGVSTVSGGRWSPTVIRRILTSPRMIGHAEGADGALVRTDVEPILTREVWERLRGKLLDPELQRFTPVRAGTYLLAGGLARCPAGTAMIHSGSPGAGTYVCGATLRDCCGTTISAGLVEADVTERVLARLTSAQYRRQLGKAMARAGSVEDQRAVLADLEDRLAQLGRDYADRVIDRATMLAGTERARANITAAEVAIVRRAALADMPPTVEDVLAWWEAADVEQQHQIVAAVLDHVVVGSSEGRQLRGADRLQYHWRKL